MLLAKQPLYLLSYIPVKFDASGSQILLAEFLTLLGFNRSHRIVLALGLEMRQPYGYRCLLRIKFGPAAHVPCAVGVMV